MQNSQTPSVPQTKHRRAIESLLSSTTLETLNTVNIHDLLKQISDTADQTLIQLWHEKNLPENIALVAVGGYGRAELFPYSDVDILVLLPDHMDLAADKVTRAKVEDFIRHCWDAGLHVGSSVRTIQECLAEAQKDITVQTALLESRYITGDQSLFEKFKAQFIEHLDAERFIHAKLAEMHRRHKKYNDSPYALEPNCKESPGGLRDLHVILWITKAAQLGANWTELVNKKLLTPLEECQIRQHESWLKLLRAHLHLYAQRHEDRLIFDVQEPIAKAMGYEATGARRASEELMRHYYRTAKGIVQANHLFMLSISELFLSTQEPPVPRPLDPYFADRAGMLDILDDDVYIKDPHQILRTFVVYAKDDSLNTFSLRTFRALNQALKLIDDDFRHDPVNTQTFIELFKSPPDIYQSIHLMNQIGVLGQYLPVFQNIVGQMQHDLFHVYTVDQHTLAVLRNLRHFFLPEHAHEYPLCSEVAAECEKPWLLYIAALFHDIAKGRQGDHSKLGAQDVLEFSRQHNLSNEETETLVFLVAEHLTMSRVAQKEDIGDPQVIQNFINTVKTESRLNALYLLTVADIRGTSPRVWNSWRAHLLEHLYKLTLHVMGGHVPEPTALVNSRKREALDLLCNQGFHEGDEQKLWATLSASYFMRHDASEIAWHTQELWDKVEHSTPVIAVRPHGNHGNLQVLVYTPDIPDVFARICSFFSMTDLSIVDARIHTTQSESIKSYSGWALDTFQLIPINQIEDEQLSNAAYIQSLEKIIHKKLQKVLQSTQDLAPPKSSRAISRRAKYFPLPPRISLNPDENHKHWLLSITAGDRIGLLYTIAYALAQKKINIQLAKIMTLGDRVEDTFLISNPQLENPVFQEELEEILFKSIKA